MQVQDETEYLRTPDIDSYETMKHMKLSVESETLLDKI